jgi:hypothetical protein
VKSVPPVIFIAKAEVDLRGIAMALNALADLAIIEIMAIIAMAAALDIVPGDFNHRIAVIFDIKVQYRYRAEPELAWVLALLLKKSRDPNDGRMYGKRLP